MHGGGRAVKERNQNGRKIIQQMITIRLINIRRNKNLKEKK